MSATGSGEGAAGGSGGAALQKVEPGAQLPPLARSKRSNTISVMSPTRRQGAAARGAAVAAAAPGAVGGGGGGLSPSFVFLQLYHNMSTYPITPPVPGETPAILNPLAERPLRVSGVQHERTIKNLDLVPPVETYKLGTLVSLDGAEADDQPHLFLNLEKGGKDGHYTYVWNDDIMQVRAGQPPAAGRGPARPHAARLAGAVPRGDGDAVLGQGPHV
ncbi:hypothetical protein HF086_006838 [Spodoptera exigua]|uniref:Uncharacterized protein n=1 Tax=Spodoptera exigua TaxID=7107 RepID=A0A922M1W7_SPOEX|nr:hypothetical protein HF086_006838 [Spodoptera exigua]